MLKTENIQINLWKEEGKHTGKVDIVDSNGESTRLCLDSSTGYIIAVAVRDFVRRKKNEQRTS